MKIVFYHRKKTPSFHSIEFVFETIRKRFQKNIFEVKTKELSYPSTGLFNRLLISFQAMLNQGDVNHVTGDIHFIALFLPAKKTILTIHDLGFMENRRGLSRMILKWFWIQLPVKHCRIITTVSESTKKEIVKYVPSAASKIKVIYNPISHVFQSNPKVFNKNAPIILQMGTKPNKNNGRLIEAIKDIFCEIYFVGKLEPIYVDALRSYKIKFKEFVNLKTSEVVELYKTCDIVSFPSTVEGFGLPIVEANAVGRVVVTSTISSMPEIANGSAELVDPFNIESIRIGIKKVIDDDAHRVQLIEKGYQNARRFDLRKIVNEYVELYKSSVL